MVYPTDFGKINLKKILGNKTGRKENKLIMKINMVSDTVSYLLSFHANIYDPNDNLIFGGYSIIPLLAQAPELKNNPVFHLILDLCEKYQLSIINSGTKEQEYCLINGYLKDELTTLSMDGHETHKEYLASHNLLTTTLDSGDSYTYGHGLIDGIPIPKDDLAKLIQLFEISKSQSVT